MTLSSAPELSLRERIETLLHGTVPIDEPVFPYAAQFSESQLDALRQFLPERLARAAVLVPLVDRGDAGLNVLLTLRASHLRNHAGQVSFPGGRIEPGDSGPWAAAVREAHEEIGLDPGHVRLAGYLRDHIVISGFRVTPVVAFVAPGFAISLDAREVEAAFEVPLDFVLDPANHVPRERHVAGVAVTTWDIPYEGRQIWGATASMLVSLSRLLRGEAP